MRLASGVSSALLLGVSIGAQHEWRFDPTHFADQSQGFRPTLGNLQVSAVKPRFAADCLIRTPEDATASAGEVPSKRDLPSRAITVEAWVAIDMPRQWGGIVSAIEDNGEYERGWLLGFRDRQFTFGLASANKQRLTYLDGLPTFRPGQWYHVVGTYDGKVQQLWIDGELSSESREQSGAILYAEAHQLVLGSYKDSDEVHPMTGALHSVAVLDEALTARKIQARFRNLSGKLPRPTGPTFSGVELPPVLPLAELQPKIGQAIDRGVMRLMLDQHRDGSWSYMLDAYRNGATSLALYALLKSQVPPEHPAVVAALRFLAARDPSKTYSYGCQLLALAATRDKKHREWAQHLVDQLVALESKSQPGGWGYPEGWVDLSNTQFAALGFFGASQLGVSVPGAVWQRMARKLIDKHQPFTRTTRVRDRTDKKEFAGFTYFERGEQWPESGSMTTAGLCVLALAEQLGGQAIDARLRLAMANSKQKAMRWLGEHYTVTGNPGEPDTTYYYLYGLERVGALLAMDDIDGNSWYRDGAQWLVAQQADDGGWRRHDQTCFALLFLTKATAPTTGVVSTRQPSAWSTTGGEVHLRASGDVDFSMWVEAFRDRRPDVLRVRYFADGVMVATIEAQAGSHEQETFPARHRFSDPGRHTLRVEVEVKGNAPTLRSTDLVVTAQVDAESWMRANNARNDGKVLRAEQAATRASSHLDGHEPNRAVDGYEATAWLCSEQDDKPAIVLDLGRAVLADRVLLSPADSCLADRGQRGRVLRIEVLVNGKSEAKVAVEDQDALAPIVVQFAGRRTIGKVEIRILEKQPGCTGFAEVLFRDGG